MHALKAQGAIILGKLHTTEFAFFDPSPACNPHNTGHTPGGSSSGSAAAVAAGMVPLAIGTQTVASVNRPAAYCGVGAFKPSTRSLITSGIAPLGPGYDTPGVFGYSVADAIHGYRAIAPDFMAAARALPKSPVIAILDDDHLADATGEVKSAVAAMVDRFASAGAKIEHRKSPIDMARLFRIQRTTMLYEAGRMMRAFLDLPAGQIGEKLRAAIVEGLEIADQTYFDERREIDGMRAMLLSKTSDVTAYLSPATPGPAPKSLAWTGDPKYIAPWTAIGGPIVTLPAGMSSDGLPLGCILAATPGQDLTLCALALKLMP